MRTYEDIRIPVISDPDNCRDIQRVALEMGYTMRLREAWAMWSEFSNAVKAQWLGLHRDDNGLLTEDSVDNIKYAIELWMADGGEDEA